MKCSRCNNTDPNCYVCHDYEPEPQAEIMRNTHRFQIGTRHFEVTLPEELDHGCNAKNFLRDNFAKIPLPPDVSVTEITDLVWIEAQSALLTAARELGMKNTERVDNVLYLRFPSSLVSAVWNPQTARWNLHCGTSWHSTACSLERIRWCLATLLADDCRVVPAGLGAAFWGLASLAAAVIVAVAFYLLN